MIAAIVCVDNNFGIGYNNKLLFHISEDMKFFKEKTINNSVIMGRKTYESIGKLLPKRENIIITSSVIGKKNIDDKSFFASADFVDGYIVGCTKFQPNKTFYIIGGESIYKKYIDIYDEIYITIVDEIRKADKHFPNLFYNSNYKLDHILKCSETEDGIKFMITKWIRK